jgi:hypothetical protein
MAKMPKHVEDNTSAAMMWRQIEEIATNQGVDPSKNEVMLHDVSASFLKSIRELERVSGLTVVRRDEQLDALVVRLFYEGPEGVPVITSTGARAIAKPTTVKLLGDFYR